LVHGLGSAGSIWKSLIPDLKEDFTVFAINLPGHGEATIDPTEEHDPHSLARRIVEFMHKKYDVTTMHVAGNSLGGWIALEMAAVAPERVKSVTALAPAGLWNQVPTWIVVENCAHVIMWNFPKSTVNYIRSTAGLA
jgi:pimeloyl-ACP methyl ester carboxylesterase